MYEDTAVFRNPSLKRPLGSNKPKYHHQAQALKTILYLGIPNPPPSRHQHVCMRLCPLIAPLTQVHPLPFISNFVFCLFRQKFIKLNMTPIFGEEKIFLKLERILSLDTLWVENFDIIALSQMVNEIEAVLCFTH